VSAYRGIDVSAGVGDGLYLLDGPAQTARVDEVLGLHAEELPHLLEALAVVPCVADRGRHRLVGGPVLQRHAQVEQAEFPEHRFGPSFTAREAAGDWLLLSLRSGGADDESDEFRQRVGILLGQILWPAGEVL
jgi:hypothetical protein